MLLRAFGAAFWRISVNNCILLTRVHGQARSMIRFLARLVFCETPLSVRAYEGAVHRAVSIAQAGTGYAKAKLDQEGIERPHANAIRHSRVVKGCGLEAPEEKTYEPHT